MKSIIVTLIVNLVSAFIGFVIGIIIKNLNTLKFNFLCNTKYANKDIRVSISYLLRIKVESKYLLVKSNRIVSQYQPVGGVYKSYITSKEVFDSLGVKEDNSFKSDKKNNGDLRIRVLGKKLPMFLKWFNSKKDRELDPHREFYEELIHNKVLCIDKFPYIQYRFIKQHNNNIKFSRYFKCYEMLISEIYELIPTDIQLEELKMLQMEENDYYKWVDSEQIDQLGHSKNTELRIGENALWIL